MKSTAFLLRSATAATLRGASVFALLAIGVGLHADSATGVGTVLGNAQSTSTRNARPNDPAWEKTKHTPSGLMFRFPFAPPPDARKSASGWEYSGHVEFGVIGGDADERNARFRSYQDVEPGAYLNNFSLLMKKPDGGYYLEATGGGAGNHDQYFGLEFGRYNDWKIKIYHSEIPHVFTDRYRSLWDGVGTGNLTLLPGLTPGGTTSTAADNAAVAAQALNSPPIFLGLERKQSGVRLDLRLSEAWRAYISYSRENRRGARPFAATWSFGTAPIEIPESIDYTTHDIAAGLMYTGELSSLNLRLAASLFRNHIDTLNFQEPYRISPGGGITSTPATGAFTQGQIDLTPDNNAYNARGEYTRSLPNFYNGTITLVLSGGRWRQNDALIPYTTIPNLVLANVTLLPNGGWDSLGSLSRRTTNASIETWLSDATLALNPTTELNLKFRARVYETNNNTDPFLVVNPNAAYTDADPATPGSQTGGLTLNGVTGVWGRLINNGTGNSVLLGANTTAAGNIPIKSLSYGARQVRLSTSGEYRLGKKSTLNASLERETMSRDNRLRDRTWDDKAKLTYVNRGLGESTLRLSYEYGRRRGSEYRISRYDDAFSDALIPIPATAGANVLSWAVRANSALRTFDLADRDQHVVNLRINTPIRPNLDAAISVQDRQMSFPNSDYGLARREQRSANLDLNYQPSPTRTIYAFYSYQLGKHRQSSIAQAFAPIAIGAVLPGGTVTPGNAVELGSAPGGPIYPLLNAWTLSSEDSNRMVGVGLKQQWGKVNLNVDYTYSRGRTEIGYNYTVGGAISANNAVFAGNGLPDLSVDTHFLDASLRFPLTERMSLRLVYRYQEEDIRDWHYRNLDTMPVVGNPAALPTAVILDSGPHDFTVNWYGVMLRIEL